MMNVYSICKGRCNYVLMGLQACIRININSIHHSLRETLSQHQGYQSGTRSDIENTVSSLSPCSEQSAIGTDFHGATVLMNGKLLKRKIVVGQFELRFMRKILTIFRQPGFYLNVLYSAKNVNQNCSFKA